MSIKPGTTVLPAKLDHLRIRADVGADRRVVADCEEAAILDRDGLRDAPVLVDRDDLAAAQHQIGGLREGAGGKCERADQGACQSRCEPHGDPPFAERKLDAGGADRAQRKRL